MRTAERGENQLARIRLPRRNRHAGAALININDRCQIGEIQFRINTVHVKIQCHRHDVQIARALPVAEQSSLDAIRTREHPEFRRGDAGAAVIVRVQADDERIAVFEVAAHPFDLIRINIWHRHFHRVRQIQNHLVLRRRLPDIHDGFGNFLRIFHLGHAETFRRILEHDFRAFQAMQTIFDHLRAVHCDGFDLLFRLAEHHAPLRRRRRIIHVNDDLLRADERLHRALDQILARLHEHLEPDIIQRALFFNEPAVERKLGVRRRGKADFDFLETDFDERLKQFQFLRHVHRHGERLVAVAQIHAAPARRVREDAVGPLPVGQVDRRERTIF